MDTNSNSVLNACTAGNNSDCSLRGAINNANLANSPGDVILFDAADFPSNCSGMSISVTVSTIPAALSGGGDTIDATGRCVTLDASGEPLANSSCIDLNSDNNVIIGLRITDCVNGILVRAGRTGNVIGPNNNVWDNTIGIRAEGGSNTIKGNFIGTNATGTAILGAGGNVTAGIDSRGASNVIGGTALADRNIIAGTVGTSDSDGAGAAIRLFTGAVSNVVKGNYIGLNAAGTASLGNGSDGILILDDSNIIGGTVPGEGNVVAGSTLPAMPNPQNANGIRISGAAGTGNEVQGNLIGTDATGAVDLGNAQDGISIAGAPGNCIGGDIVATVCTAVAGGRNVIAGNNSDGIEITGAGATGNVLSGNYVGINAAGSAAVLNSANGVFINGIGSNTVGGTTDTARNVISGNGSDGVELSGAGATSNTVQGNYIGTDASGSAALANTLDGIRITDVGSNSVGGSTAGARNVISGNSSDGVELSGAGATGNTIQGNYIGTNAAGSGALPNALDGVRVTGAGGNTVGGVAAGARNVISGNGSDGVELSGAGATTNVIQGNYVGTNAAGSGALANALNGILVSGAGTNTIGGTAAGARNVISGNGSDGIELSGAGATGNTIQGNFVGTNAAGAAALPNALDGMRITGVGSNTVGGTTAGARNIIAGNNSDGVELSGAGATGNTIQGNYIGTNESGSAAVPNAQDGVRVSGSPSNVLGGAVGGAGNVISGNAGTGVQITDAGSTGNLVQGNLIGVRPDGVTALANGSDGVRIFNNASNNQIGGAGAAANTIANNGGDGVFVSSGTGNLISSNSIHSNAGLGIELDGNGVNPNDASDPDSGPNNIQNYPTLIGAMAVSGTTNIRGTLNSIASTNFSLEFFANTQCDSSGNGEGQSLIGSTGVSTDAGGDVTFNASFPMNVPIGQYVTATATAPGGHTSEFSACAQVQAITVNSNADPGDGACTVENCTLREALTATNATPALDTIRFAIGSGAQTIAPTSGYTISQPVILDATTQPGFTAAPIIEINGAGAGAGATGLTLNSHTGSTIKGLVVNRFSVNGITLNSGGQHFIQGNYLGTDLAGSVDMGNTIDGLLVMGSTGNTIGGDATVLRNVISGNNQHGIRISTASATNNTIVGNYIGINAAGSGALANSQDGVRILDARDNFIGLPGIQRNVISGNGSVGVRISNATSTGNLVRNNYLGANAAGTAGLQNVFAGVSIDSAPNNTVGGLNAAARNVISGNRHGIVISGGNAANTLVQGNFIGTNPSGTAALANTDNGVQIHTGAHDNVIGGMVPGAGNVISGNSGEAVLISTGIVDNIIQGNLIGTAVDGITARPNGSHGVSVGTQTGNNLIGGTAPGEANTIAFNNGDGVFLQNGAANTVSVNSIHSNVGLGIDLASNGVTANDVDDPDTGANNLQNFPLLTSAVIGASDTTIAGTLNSTPSTTFAILFFFSPDCDASGHGEGRTLLGSITQATDAGGDTAINAVLPVTVPAASFITATATDPAGNNSEFSACIVAGDDADDDDDGFTDTVEAGTPLCNGSNNDTFDDAVIDDGCPGGPAQAGTFSEGQFKIGTGAQDPCGTTGWPLDLVGTVPSVNEFDIVDLGSFVAPVRRMGKNPNQAGFSSRWDLVPGPGMLPAQGWINIIDLAATSGGGTAFPPMLGGAKALNQMCPFPP